MIAAEASCAHCGAALPQAAERFCCAGCAAAYELVNRLGLGRYYERRDAALDAPQAAEAPDPAEITSYIRTEADGIFSLCAMLGGLRCAACLWLIESALGAQDGVVSARVAFSTGRLHLRWRGAAERGAVLLALVCRLGYQARPYDPALLSPQSGNLEERELLRAMAVAGFASGNIMLLSVAVWAGNVGEMGSATRDLLHWVSALIALPAIAYAGRPFFRSAWSALRAGRANMDVPISVGVALAAGASLFATIESDAHAYFDSGGTYHTRYTTWEFFRGQEGDPWKAVVAKSTPQDAAHARMMRQDQINRTYMPTEAEHSQTLSVDAGIHFLETNVDADQWMLQLELFETPADPAVFTSRFPPIPATRFCKSSPRRPLSRRSATRTRCRPRSATRWSRPGYSGLRTSWASPLDGDKTSGYDYSPGEAGVQDRSHRPQSRVGELHAAGRRGVLRGGHEKPAARSPPPTS